jgi:hypothetical protein
VSNKELLFVTVSSSFVYYFCIKTKDYVLNCININITQIVPGLRKYLLRMIYMYSRRLIWVVGVGGGD